MKFNSILIVLVLLGERLSESANILVYIQVPLYSHQTAFRPVWRELANRGHKITFITSEPMQYHENITHIHIKRGNEIMDNHKYHERISTEPFSMDLLKMLVDMSLELLDYELTLPDVQRILRKERRFDLLISEFLIPPIGAAMSKKLGIPFIGVTSLDGHFEAHATMGNPDNPIIYPSYDMPFKDKPTLVERMQSTLFAVITRMVCSFYIYPALDNVLVKHFHETCSSLDNALKNVSMYFVNANPIFCTLRPLTPQTINIGGFVHIDKPQPLPNHLQDYLDKATEGCIYFSLGTNLQASKIPKQKIQIFLQAFEQLPYKVLWKFEEKLPNTSTNVKTEKWLPQQDILRHKNVKVFVTQGGLQSIEEAIFYRVPIVGIPFFGDQFNNINKIVGKDMGLGLDHHELTVAQFRDSIAEVIENPKYRENVNYQAELALDQPATAVEKAVWWTEYVIRHKGGQHLRNPGIDLPFYQRYLLDVVVVFTAMICAFVYTAYVFLAAARHFLGYCLETGRKLKTS